MAESMTFNTKDGESWPYGGISSVEVFNNKTNEHFTYPITHGIQVEDKKVDKQESRSSDRPVEYSELQSMFSKIMGAISTGYGAVNKDSAVVSNDAEPTQIISFAEPNEYKEDQNVDWLSDVGLSFLAEKPKDPDIRVTFETPSGTFMSRYHEVITDESMVVLVFDTRCDRDRFIPAKSTENDPIFIGFSADFPDRPSYKSKIVVSDIDFKLGPLFLQVLFVSE